MVSDENESVDSAAVRMSMHGDVLVVRLDDGKANALTHEILGALGAAAERAESEATAMVLVGREGKFSAGFDLSVMTAGPEQALNLLGAGARWALKLFMLKVPVVFGVTGHSLAMGAIATAAVDYRVGAEGPFKLGLNEVGIGMPVPRFAVEVTRDRLSPPWFARSAQLGEVLDPRQALQAGYLDEVVAPEEVIDRSIEIATRLGAYVRPTAFALTRTNVRGALAQRLVEELEADLSEFSVEA